MSGLKQFELMEQFYKLHPVANVNQVRSFEHIVKNDSALIELPTGSGKTAVGLSYLMALRAKGVKRLYYVVPTKALVAQVCQQYGDVVPLQPAFGRNEHECFYYPPDDEGRNFRADEIPCLMLVDCPHRVDVETGEQYDPEETPRCPYYEQKWLANTSGKIIVCTAAYYFFSVLRNSEEDCVGAVVFDEVHGLAKTIRNIMSYDITDLHIERAIELVKGSDGDSAVELRKFLTFMKRVVKRAPPGTETLLRSSSIRALIGHLESMNASSLYKQVVAELTAGRIDSVKERETLTALERILRGIGRYIRSLRFALPEGDRPALDYVFAFHRLEYDESEDDAKSKVRHKLVVRGYYVAPLIRSMMAPFTLAYSATIGSAEVFGFESGIKLPFLSLSSTFPPENARVYLPTDAPDLSWKGKQKKGSEARVLRRLARMCRRFADNGIRSLVVVVSDKERTSFLTLCEEEGVQAVSYGGDIPSREALQRFKDGEGSVLIGTTANFGQGVDLPEEMAPVMIFLRPGYPLPDAPESVFEEERFGAKRWRLINWRVAIEALQARGRNVRSASDRGVTFFVSKQFLRFLPGMMPKWLEPAYRDRFTFDECEADTLALLGKVAK